MGKITPQPGIMDIALYQGGASKIEGANRVTKLSSNENPHGASPKAREAYLSVADDLALYPSTDHTPLRQAIADVHDMDPDRIICGAGSDEIISFLCNAYTGVGDEVLHTEHGFLMYPISAKAAGATPVVARERERTTDVDALIEAMTERTKLVFIANPNNPTGTLIGSEEVERLADALPEGAMLVLDGAYAEYVNDPDFDAGKDLVESRENVVMTRTSDPSSANFILTRFKDEDQARRADEWLKKGSIVVRHVASYGLPECLRITIGDETACRAIAKFLSEFMAGER